VGCARAGGALPQAARVSDGVAVATGGGLRDGGSEYAHAMWSWIMIGVLYVLVLGGYRLLGGIAAAGDALREWGHASSKGSHPAVSSS
jgi:hypothetical protein